MVFLFCLYKGKQFMLVSSNVPFVICRNGKLLVEMDNRFSQFSTIVKVGHFERTSTVAYYFPLDVAYQRLIEMDTLYTKAEYIEQVEQSLPDILKMAKTNKHREMIKAVVAEEMAKVPDIHARISEIQASSLAEPEDEDYKGDPYLCFTSNGTMMLARTEYLYMDPKLYKGKRVSKNGEALFMRRTGSMDLPVMQGSEWVVCPAYENRKAIQTAMKCTSSFEDLTLLLRKIGIITSGEWVNVHDYFVNNKIKQMIDSLKVAMENEVNKVFQDKLTEIRKSLGVTL